MVSAGSFLLEYNIYIFTWVGEVFSFRTESSLYSIDFKFEIIDILKIPRETVWIHK